MQQIIHPRIEELDPGLWFEKLIRGKWTAVEITEEDIEKAKETPSYPIIEGLAKARELKSIDLTDEWITRLGLHLMRYNEWGNYNVVVKKDTTMIKGELKHVWAANGQPVAFVHDVQKKINEAGVSFLDLQNDPIQTR